MGDSSYLRYGMSFFQFILLTYALGIERFPALEGIFSHLWIYALAFLVIYPPSSIILGHLHRKRQLKIDTIIAIEQNVISGYNAYIGMTQFIRFLEASNFPVMPEYREMAEYWKSIGKNWRPR